MYNNFKYQRPHILKECANCHFQIGTPIHIRVSAVCSGLLLLIALDCTP